MNHTSPDLANVESAWRDAVLENLARGKTICQRAARYIVENEIEIGFSRQKTGARWTLNRRIELNSASFSKRMGTSPTNSTLLGFIVHEAIHLEQGAALALSVKGELDAWQAQREACRELGAPIRKDVHWQALAVLTDNTSQDLGQARREMLRREGYRYLVWLLPLRPNLITRFIENLQKIFYRNAFRKGDRA